MKIHQIDCNEHSMNAIVAGKKVAYVAHPKSEIQKGDIAFFVAEKKVAHPRCEIQEGDIVVFELTKTDKFIVGTPCYTVIVTHAKHWQTVTILTLAAISGKGELLTGRALSREGRAELIKLFNQLNLCDKLAMLAEYLEESP